MKQLKRKDAKWREQRNKQAAHFHEVRRASKAGHKAGLDAKVAMADPNRPHLQSQATPEPTKDRKAGINELIGGAKTRSGHR